MRYVIENKNYKRIDIFHNSKINENYKKRKPYRYNLEYRPSLYLASTLYCCCNELDLHDNKQMVIGSMFRMYSKTKQELFIVDLGNRGNKYKRANIGNTEHGYMFTYLFIAVCSVVALNKNKRNIIEYKITEFLYLWLVKHYDDKLCGIRYFTCYDGCYNK